MWCSTRLVLETFTFHTVLNDFENCLDFVNPDMYADDTCVNIPLVNLNELLTALKNELEYWKYVEQDEDKKWFVYIPAKLNMWL